MIGPIKEPIYWLNVYPRIKMIKMHYMNGSRILTIGDIIDKSDNLASQI